MGESYHVLNFSQALYEFDDSNDWIRVRFRVRFRGFRLEYVLLTIAIRSPGIVDVLDKQTLNVFTYQVRKRRVR